MKKCIKCDREKPLTEFYKHKQMADGHLNKCKECTIKETNERLEILKEDPDWVKKERERTQKKYHRLYRKTVKTAEQAAPFRADKNWKQNYPEKVAATRVNSSYLKKHKESHVHHWSYNKIHYKDVIELSKSDHYLAHTRLIYDQEFYYYRTLSNELLDTKEKHINYLQSIGITIIHAA